MTRLEFLLSLLPLGLPATCAQCFNCKQWHGKQVLRELKTAGGIYYYCRRCDDEHARAAGLECD